MARLNKLLTGHQITDEVINRADSTSLPLGHDTILNDGTLEIWTGASGTGSQLALTTDYTLGSEDTRLTTEAGETVYTKLAIVNGAHQSTNLYVTYKTVGDYASVESVYAVAKETEVRNQFILGGLVLSEFDESPSVDFPAVPRNVNQDLLLADWPMLVPKLRMQAANVLGVTDHAVTVAANVITFGIGDTALISLIVNDAIVTNYINSGEPANFLNGSTYAVAAAQRTITISGVDYAITGADAVARTLTVSVNPPAGAQTATCYTYRVAGAANTARLLRIAGFVGVAAGDAGGEVVGGFRKMDRGQGHRHQYYANGLSAATGVARAAPDTINPTSTYADVIRQSITDGTNGTPRTGKTTDPRTAGQYAYTWGAVYIP